MTPHRRRATHAVSRRPGQLSTSVAWWLGARTPKPVGDALAAAIGWVASLGRVRAVDEWADTVTRATGKPPTRRQRRLLLENWARNNLWSLRLSRWKPADVRRFIRIDPRDSRKLEQSLAGPGLVLALPHMGSWDGAGVWSAHNGIKVVSVAERLPRGVFERFRDARRAMGMTIYPLDEPQLMAKLAADVARCEMVCLLSDRDLSSRGARVPWPGGRGTVGVPAGPAVLARRTGADLRVVTTHFDGPALRLEVSDPVGGDDVTEMMTGVVARFAEAVERHPESWLMLRRIFVDQP